MFTDLKMLRTSVHRICCGIMFWSLILCSVAMGRNFLYENITDLPNGPGAGRWPDINDSGDIAFLIDTTVWFYDRSEGSFLNVTALPSAPAEALFLKMNNSGNIAMIEPTTKDLWLFEASAQTFTNVSSLPTFPSTGNTQANFLGTVFDLNDNNKMSFHSGDRNTGDIYVYDHDFGTFEEITDKPGGNSRGRENKINNADQVVYMGFPSAYVYDPATNTTTNINDLPGGPGPIIANLDLNDQGDVTLMSGTAAWRYEAAFGTFLDLTSLADWPHPASISSSDTSDLSNHGEITFWREELYYFNSVDQSFTQLNGISGGPPIGGLETSINRSSRIALGTGGDVYLATLLPLADFDLDGDVDGDDFLTWQSNFGLTVGATRIQGDADGDGDVDGDDFLTWQGEFGSDGGPTVAVVPEPSTIALASAAALVLVGTLCRKLRRSVS